MSIVVGWDRHIRIGTSWPVPRWQVSADCDGWSGGQKKTEDRRANRRTARCTSGPYRGALRPMCAVRTARFCTPERLRRRCAEANFGQRPMCFSLSEFSKARLCARFQKAKLREAQLHFQADLFLGLLFQVEPRQNFTVTSGHPCKHRVNKLTPFEIANILLRTLGDVRHLRDRATYWIGDVPSMPHSVFDMLCDLSAHDRANETHQALGGAQFSPSDCTDDDQEDIVNSILQLVGAKVATDLEPNALSDDTIHPFGSIIVSRLYSLNQRTPVRRLRSSPGSDNGLIAGRFFVSWHWLCHWCAAEQYILRFSCFVIGAAFTSCH